MNVSDGLSTRNLIFGLGPVKTRLFFIFVQTFDIIYQSFNVSSDKSSNIPKIEEKH